jgi:hypothetical protein
LSSVGGTGFLTLERSSISGCARAVRDRPAPISFTSARHEPVHQRLFRAQQVGMAHRAAHDPAQHIAAPFVRGQHAIGQQEAGGAQMIGDHAVARLVRPGGIAPVSVLDAAISALKVSVS